MLFPTPLGPQIAVNARRVTSPFGLYVLNAPTDLMEMNFFSTNLNPRGEIEVRLTRGTVDVYGTSMARETSTDPGCVKRVAGDHGVRVRERKDRETRRISTVARTAALWPLFAWNRLLTVNARGIPRDRRAGLSAESAAATP